MKIRNILLIVVFVLISAFVIFVAEYKFGVFSSLFSRSVEEKDFLIGSGEGEHGKITIKIRVDNIGAIKEVFVSEHPDNETANAALQKLIRNSLDKQDASEIDDVSGATETSTIYKGIITKLLKNTIEVDEEEKNVKKVSFDDENIRNNIERIKVNEGGFKSGLGGYVMNHLEDADYYRDGNLVTNEYICAVLLNPHNRIEDVKFDHITSNISFTKNGAIPTGGARAYEFTSDKSKSGFNGLINDGNYINIFDFEKIVLTYRHFEDVKNRYINKKGYAPLIYALENAIENSRYVGANSGDTLGLSTYKVLKKRDIVDATEEENGHVKFVSQYCLLTTAKDKSISSCMLDNVINLIKITNSGRVFGSRDKEIYTLNELANTEKYTKIDEDKYYYKMQLNALAEFMRGNTIDNMLTLINDLTDDKGSPKAGTLFENLKDVDFIEFIDLVSRAFVDAVKVKVN